MDNLLLYSKLMTLPDELKVEVADFIDFLIAKSEKESGSPSDPKPTFGSGKGTYVMHDDFDEPLDDFQEYIN